MVVLNDFRGSEGAKGLLSCLKLCKDFFVYAITFYVRVNVEESTQLRNEQFTTGENF